MRHKKLKPASRTISELLAILLNLPNIQNTCVHDKPMHRCTAKCILQHGSVGQKPWGPHLVSFQKVPEYLMSMGSIYAMDLPQHIVASGLRPAQSPSLLPAPGLAPMLLLLLPGRFLRPGTGRTKTVTEAQCQCPKDKPLHSGRDPKARSLCMSRSTRQHTRTN